MKRVLVNNNNWQYFNNNKDNIATNAFEDVNVKHSETKAMVRFYI